MRTLDLQKVRKVYNVTQLRLAELTGYPQGFISRVENRKAPAPAELINKVAEVFSIGNIDDFIIPDDDEVRRALAIEERHNAEQARLDRLIAIIETRDRQIEKLENQVAKLQKIIDKQKKS